MPPSPRFPAMDVLRGCAVLGILWMNVTAFAFPQAVYINPAASGWSGAGDIAFWAVSFILVDGKMRGLFALLFGASMLLLIDKEEMAGRDGRRTQRVRLGWLFVIGCAHYLLLWWGDILRVYAIVGLVALLFVGREPLDLVKCALLSFLAQFLLLATFIATLYMWRDAAQAADATASLKEGYSAFLRGVSDPAAPQTVAEIAAYRSGFADIIAMKIAAFPGEWVWGFLFNAFETLGFMLLGMAMLKAGFLTGAWDGDQYRRTARHCFLIGLPPMIAMALWTMWSGFAPLTTYGVTLAWSLPFRIPLTVGWAALILWRLKAAPDSAAGARLAAAGRMTLSNYLASSLLMAAIFYGWGLGLFAHVRPAALPLFIAVGWLLILIWSRPWMNRWRMGPAEWLWRSASSGRLQKIRRSA